MNHTGCKVICGSRQEWFYHYQPIKSPRDICLGCLNPSVILSLEDFQVFFLKMLLLPETSYNHKKPYQYWHKVPQFIHKAGYCDPLHLSSVLSGGSWTKSKTVELAQGDAKLLLWQSLQDTPPQGTRHIWTCTMRPHSSAGNVVERDGGLEGRWEGGTKALQ